MQKNTGKINSLTSLRFFAACMILILHTNGVLFHSLYAGSFFLQLGVSVFFVLSGFILTYVYPKLERKDILPFIKSRFARIWPAHMAALILACIILHDYVQLVPNKYFFILCSAMVHSWIPLEYVSMKFNQPSWSVSTEFFFYLCFPILIYRFTKNWYIKLFAAFFLTMSILACCHYFQLLPTSDHSISTIALIYLHPFSRLFEFVIGMSTALLYRKLAHINFNFFFISFLEIFFIGLLLLLFGHGFHLHQTLFYHSNNAKLNLWLTLCGGSSLFIAIVILLLALQKGVVNKMLNFSLFVSLGEISYSLYLVHNIFLSYYGAHIADFDGMSMALRNGLYWTTVFTTAYLMWRFVEIPCRRLINQFNFRETIRKFIPERNPGKEQGEIDTI